ncbi:MAG: DUF2085 domain-containing protein [Anaerolineae bacterium]
MADETQVQGVEGVCPSLAGTSVATLRRRLLLLAVVVAVSAAVAAKMPDPLRELVDGVGLAVCHRWPAHSFFLGGKQLPVCARCTGTFLGAALSLMFLMWRGRTRAGNLPPTPVLMALIFFMAAWATDGLNSYLSVFPGLPHLYEPHNLLRLATGFLAGIALTNLALPVVHLTLWQEPTRERSLENWRELGVLVGVAFLIGALIAWGPAPLFGPVALWSAGGVVALLTLANAVIVAVVLGRGGHARSLWGLAAPLLAGFLLTAAEIAAIVCLRTWLEARFGLPL